MAQRTQKIEIGNVDSVKQPVTEKALAKTQTALEGFRLAENATDLKAEDISETWELPVNWPEDRVAGRQWEMGDQNGGLKVLVYDSEVRKKLGELFAEKKATLPHFHLHGQLNFWRSIEGADFSGIMYFLGDGDHLEEIKVFSEYTHAATNDVSHAMVDFAATIGLSRLVVDAQNLTDLPGVEHRVTVMKRMGDDISGALEKLQYLASGGT